MAYAIKYEYRERGRLRVGWISEYGDYVTGDSDGAERFGKQESAESHALLLAIRKPEYLGKLKVAVLVVVGKGADVHWVEKKRKKEV